MELKQLLGMSLGAALLALLTGRTFRRILIWPFKWIAAKTQNKKDDQLIEDAHHDLGLPPEQDK